MKPFILRPLICAIVPLLLLPLTQYLALAPWGWQQLLFLEAFFVLGCGVVPLTLMLAATASLRSDSRRDGSLVAICAVTFAPSLILGFFFGQFIRMNAFQDLARRSGPLVTAIKAHESKYGGPPSTLNDLVPEFLPDVPRTQIGAYPDYQFEIPKTPADYDGNSWVLSVDVPRFAGYNADRFLYFPRQNYPRRGYGGSLQRIGDWAYVHE